MRNEAATLSLTILAITLVLAVAWYLFVGKNNGPEPDPQLREKILAAPP